MNPAIQTPGQKLRQAVAAHQPLQVVGAVTAYCAILAQKPATKRYIYPAVA